MLGTRHTKSVVVVVTHTRIEKQPKKGQKTGFAEAASKKGWKRSSERFLQASACFAGHKNANCI